MEHLLHPWQPWLEGLLGLSSAAYVGGLWWFNRGIHPCSAQGAGQPALSVVVAARDEEARIGGLLADLEAQTYPPDRWEVIVVDDASSDRTAALVEARLAGPLRLRLLRGEGTGKKAALNQGIAAARGEIILTTDADCRVPPGWVAGMAACFGPRVDMAVGFSQIGRCGELRGKREGLEAVDFLNLMAAALGSANQGCALAASGQNLAFREEVFARVGGYGLVRHRASGDDVLLLQLFRRFGGGQVVFAADPATYVVHPPSPSWGALLAQRARWASNAPYQVFLNPGFFAYLGLAFGANLLLALGPLLVLAGGMGAPAMLAAWGGKTLAEGLLCWRASAFFGRRDLRRFFPLWALAQPFYLVLAGVLGSLGRFTWKGRRHRWGRKAFTP
jgi:glycosyltransferase involved in cell wall biosynthesis